jgi:cobalt-precorrin 5A hydrolase/precorrin-3B C17-methyltransferase
VVIAYEVYIELARPLLKATQEIMISPIGQELQRAGQAIDMAVAGRSVALLSSGDIGIYAMGAPIFELLRQRGWTGETPEVVVYPGVSAIQAVAARLGAPLGHDFCTISLSDLLTPWPVIERRLQAAAWGDFVIGFYNPRSQKRTWQLHRAQEILLSHRAGTTPVALVRNVTRPDETLHLTTLAELDPEQVDMFTLVLVGNSQSFTLTGQRLVTPRGYARKTAGPEVSTPERRVIPDPRSTTRARPEEAVYPLTLTQTGNLQAVVVGGGLVGQRKVRGILEAGGRVRLISPEATPELQAWAQAGRLEWLCRPYQAGDLAGTALVFAATNQREINHQVAAEAKALGLWCNVADRPEEGNFHVPAVHRRPGLVISVSTGGQSPAGARLIRDALAAWLADQQLEI